MNKNIDKTKNELNNILDRIKEITKKIEICNNKNIFTNYNKYFSQELKIQELENKLSGYNSLKNIFDIEINNKNIKKQINEKISEINKNITKLEKEIKENNEKLLEYNDYKNDFVLFNEIDNIDELINELKLNTEKKDKKQNKLNEYEKQKEDIQNYMENMNIEKEMENIKNLLEKEENKSYKKYDDYCEIIKEKEILEKDYNKTLLDIEKAKNNKNNLQKQIDENESKLNEINKQKEKYDIYRKYKLEHKKIEKDYEEIKADFKFIKNKREKILEENKKIVAEHQTITTLYNKYIELFEKKNDYNFIKCLLTNNDGIIDKILKNEIIVKLREIINSITKSIGHTQIEIDIAEMESRCEVIISTKNGENISQTGHFEKSMIELIFRMAFTQINSYIKCGLLMVDEIFDGCSNQNRDMVLKLIEHFKYYYNKMIVISHDTEISNMFDSRIRIKQNNNGNIIEQ